ncbi:DUF5347 family protein [Photorhabdus sp. SF281]|uniref:DUF5347 family protein n=1 Tax=Photorhabdus sp. SF281 TaxID=3459527 RepID=UPI004043D09C
MNTEYQFESSEQRAFSISFETRVNGLNKVAQVRTQYFKSDNKELSVFINEMRDKRSENYVDNKRVLAAIFYIARIPTNRHELALNELTREEMISLIRAINIIKETSVLLPNNLSLPN